MVLKVSVSYLLVGFEEFVSLDLDHAVMGGLDHGRINFCEYALDFGDLLESVVVSCFLLLEDICQADKEVHRASLTLVYLLL